MGFQVSVQLRTLQEASYVHQNETINIFDLTTSVLQILARNVLCINTGRREARGDGLVELLVLS